MSKKTKDELNQKGCIESSIDCGNWYAHKQMLVVSNIAQLGIPTIIQYLKQKYPPIWEHMDAFCEGGLSLTNCGQIDRWVRRKESNRIEQE